MKTRKICRVYDNYDGLYVELVKQDVNDRDNLEKIGPFLSTGSRYEAERICGFVNEIINKIKKQP